MVSVGVAYKSRAFSMHTDIQETSNCWQTVCSQHAIILFCTKGPQITGENSRSQCQKVALSGPTMCLQPESLRAPGNLWHTHTQENEATPRSIVQARQKKLQAHFWVSLLIFSHGYFLYNPLNANHWTVWGGHWTEGIWRSMHSMFLHTSYMNNEYIPTQKQIYTYTRAKLLSFAHW